MIFIPWLCIFASVPCSTEFLSSEKNIKKTYEIFKKAHATCEIRPENYLEFSKRAYLAGQYSMAIWSSKTGIARSRESSAALLELNYFLGISYLEKDRFEEAIKTLKTIVYDPNWQKKEADMIQKSHLALIEAYYKRDHKKDENVKYLVRLFKTRYASGNYMFTLRTWVAEK